MDARAIPSFGPADDRLPLVVDEDAERIHKLLAREGDPYIAREIRGLNGAVRKLVPRPVSGTICGLESAQYIDACIAATQALLQEHHRGYSSLRWLWYLRRTPDELFGGAHPGTLGYDRALAEALTWWVNSTDTRLESERPLRFPVDEAVARHVLRLVAGTKFLSQLHVLARLAGKGASFSVSGELAPLTALPQTLPQDAIAIYDRRVVDAGAHLSAGLGLTPSPLRPDQISDSEFKVLLLNRCEPHVIRCNVAHGVDLVDANITCRSAFWSLPVEHFLLPFGHPLKQESYPSAQALGLLMFLMTCSLFILRAPWSAGSLFRHGYFLVREELALETLRDVLERIRNRLHSLGYADNLPETESHWLEILESTPPLLWPAVRGGFVRRLKALLAFDLAAASQAALDFFQAKRLSGEAGNQRARQFELNVQAAINETEWKPPTDILALRGRPLTIDGKVITDLDAVAARERTLVLVSCKSIIYDASYDAGRFAAINNARTIVSDAVAAWKKKVDVLTAPRGEASFDFSAYDDFIGVVCTPFAPYTGEEAALRFLRPGLRAAVSASELVGWLRSARVNVGSGAGDPP